MASIFEWSDAGSLRNEALGRNVVGGLPSAVPAPGSFRNSAITSLMVLDECCADGDNDILVLAGAGVLLDLDEIAFTMPSDRDNLFFSPSVGLPGASSSRDGGQSDPGGGAGLFRLVLVPEPATMTLLGTGLVSLGWLVSGRTSKRARGAKASATVIAGRYPKGAGPLV